MILPSLTATKMSASTGSPKLPILKKETKSAASSLFTKTDSKLNNTLSFIERFENDIKGLLFGSLSVSVGIVIGLWLSPTFTDSDQSNIPNLKPRLVQPYQPAATPAYILPNTPTDGSGTGI